MFCLNGDEVIRQIGPNFDALVDKYEKMVAVGKLEEAGDQHKKWIPYGSSYQAYYEEKLKGHSATDTSDL